MSETMIVQGTALQIKEYRGKRVVTFKDIVPYTKDLMVQLQEISGKTDSGLSAVLIFTK